MTILQQPDALSFSMNLKPFKISATADVVFSLSQGDAVLLSQILSPDADGQVEISLRDVIHDRLSCQVPPTADPYQQSSVAADFTAVIDGQSVTFRVIRGGVDRLSGTVTDFLKANFLTWQPNVKPVTYSSPEFLSYYAVSSGCSLKVKAWFTDASGNVTAGATKTICSLTKGVVTTVSVQYAVIAGLYAGSLPAYYDVWVASGSTALTYTQRYYANVMQSEEEQWIFFENSLGGIDTFRTFGAVSLDAEHTHHIAEIDDVAYEYRVDTERKWTVNTGHLDILERRWLLDFFPSAGKYVYAGSAVRRIVLTEDSVSYRFRELPSSYSFTFRFAEALPLLNLPRHELPVEMLDITVPDIGSFTLPPRLLEFSRLPLSEGVLFPVQSPYAEEWGVATLAGIAQYVSSLIDIPSPGISRNDIIRLLSAQLTPLDPLHPEDSLIDPSWLPESYGGTTDISHVAGLQNALDTLTGQLSNKLDVRFFNSIFTVYDSDGNAIVPNTYTQVADNLRILVGTWTDEYLSALGKNPSGGGSGGTGSVNSIKVATNAYLDPDSNGIIDMSGYVVSSADRTRWDAAAAGGHTHSNKSVLDGITAAKISSWDAVASIMGTDSDTVINKWNEVVAFLDTYTEADTLANLLSNKLDVRFFNSIFTVYDSDGNAIVPNTYTQVADNLRILVGTWTDEYLSALGKNPSSGGTGGTGSVNSIKVAANVFRDPDADGIIDLTADIVSSADRTRWNAASTNSHTHSNKSVLDGITAGKVSSWDAVASIMGTDSDTVINKWNEVVAFLDDISEESTLDGLLSAKANSSVTISAGNGLTGGGNLQANRSLSILLQTNSGLVASSSGLKLDIINNLTTNNVYKALSAAQGKALNDRLVILEAMFTREGSGTSADPYVIKANYGLYTDDFLSALGKNPSGGGTGGTGSVNSIKVAANVFRDPDADGIIDLTADIVSSADRTRWNAASTNSHTHSNKSVLDGITAGKVSSWDAVASIMGTDSDTVINKWNEVVAFLDTYIEADTLANLLSNKADKSDVYSASASRTKNYVLAAPSSQNGAASFRKLVSADIPDLSSSYATASRATALEGYFTNGVAKTAAKLSTVSKTAWGKTFWTSGGVPQDVDGTLTISGGELMIWNTADTSAENRWDMRFAWSGEIFQMWAYEDAYHDLSIGSTAAATVTYKGLYYDASEKRWGIGTSTPAYTLDVKGSIASTSAITLAGTTEAARRIYFGDTSHYIELDADGYFHFSHGLYSDSFVSALGKNPSGGGSGTGSFDEESMWTALGTTSTAKVIASSHIPNLSASKITSGTFAAARIPIATASAVGGIKVGTTLAISDGVLNQKSGIATAGTYRSVTVDTYGRVTAGTNPTTLSGYGILDDANSRYYALSGGTDLEPSSSNTFSLDTKTAVGNYYCSTNTASQYVTEKPSNSTNHAFRLWVSTPTGTSNYRRQRFQYYDQPTIYERYYTGSSWGNWILVQTNLANYAIASSLDDYLPLSGGEMTGALTWKNATALSGVTSTNYVLCIDGFADGGTTHYITTANLSVGSATKATQDGDGRTITSTYLTAIGRSGDYITQTKDGTTSNVTHILERNGTYIHATAATGWYRIGRFLTTASQSASCVLLLSRTYNYKGNESYAFSITLSYSGKISISQLAGYYHSTQLIDKIRVEYVTDNSSFYPAIDIHVNENTTGNNSYRVTFIGGAQALSEFEKNPTLTGSTFEYNVNTGMGTAIRTTDRIAITTGNSNGVVGLLASTNRGVYDHSTSTWIVGTNGTDTWLSQGNVGIGNTAPAYKLDVNGSTYSYGYIYLGRNNYGLYTKDSGGSVRNTVNLNSANELLIGYGTAGAGYNTYLYGNSITLKYGTSRTTGITLSSSGATTFAGTIEAKSSAYNYTTDATSYGLNMHNSDIVNVNGIFTNDVADNWTEGINFKRTDSKWDSLWAKDGYFYMGYNGNATISFMHEADFYERAINIVGESYTMSLAIGSGKVNRGLYCATSSNWLIYFNASNTILNYGRVGIGIASPLAQLHVAGNTAINGTLYMRSDIDSPTVNSDSGKIKFNSATLDGTNIYRSPYIQGVGGSSYGRKRLGFFQSNATNYTDDFVEAMSIMPTGRVGIGTTAPSYLLHVNGTMAGKECRALSDIRRKDIIGEIHISVADIAAAPSILFTWKDETDKAVHGGTTAQYWQPIAPYYVNEGDDGALDLNYAGLALSASIENSKLLLTHDTEIELLKKENRELKMRVRKLERRVA
ncbi:MAG: hypothetical protein E7100_02960 [Bacteroidaceae bacterium]|nr:hypothetical protein [Bacteroidaceae bacterium]